ncbi:MAG TPA: M12 family metallo-peptidase, partial [Verrucomicrobiae bacterium]
MRSAGRDDLKSSFSPPTWRVFLALALLALLPLFSHAQNPRAEELWPRLDSSAPPRAGAQPWVQPAVHRAVGLNVGLVRSVLARAPMEGRITPAAPAVELTLPMPDSTFARFRIVESPVMSPELAAKFPEIKTYLGQGIDDPSATLRCDLTPAGFHAQVITPSGWWYIDPLWRGDDTRYASYFKRDHQRAEDWACLTPASAQTAPAATLTTDMLSVGTTLRTYRLAVAATGEYTAFHGGTVSAGMAAIVTAVNRITGVYELELAIRLVLVANNNLLVYTNASTDPYSNTSASALLTQNQANTDSVIGSANYDIGHVFGTGGGGLSSVAVVCVSGKKAQSETGSSSPIGDSYYIDYVAHEMGHEFGALHTFNSTTGSCGGGNRDAGDAYEVGSGTTIMAYAGICGADNTQLHSDPYFHFISFQEIITDVTSGSGAGCPASTSTGNTPPNVSAGLDYIIPQSTPFKLTAIGTDPDGDPLTFCWEERDLGAAQALTDPDNGTSPLFRSFNPTNDPSRTFPRLPNLLSNTSSLGEKLPTTSRLLKFRVTARDNRAGGGGVASADMQLTVDSASGPFVVTSPNTATNWSGKRAVTWSVAGTAGAPVNCASVNILLSTDGGNTFPHVLASNTPNDGSEVVVLPNINTTTAR